VRREELVFVDVDTQHDFMDEDGALYVPGAELIKPRLRQLTRLALEKGIPILGSVDAHSKDDPEFKSFPPHCIKGTPGQRKIPETTTENLLLLPEHEEAEAELAPGSQVILEKSVYSLFDNVNAEPLLRKAGRSSFAVYGVATDYCVKAAAEGLLERGYKVYVLKDAVKAVDVEAGEKALKRLVGKGAVLITTEELMQALG